MTQPFTAFVAPGYNPPNAESVQGAYDSHPASYNIPPVAWMIAFLLIGYIGLRFLLED